MVNVQRTNPSILFPPFLVLDRGGHRRFSCGASDLSFWFPILPPVAGCGIGRNYCGFRAACTFLFATIPSALFFIEIPVIPLNQDYIAEGISGDIATLHTCEFPPLGVETSHEMRGTADPRKVGRTRGHPRYIWGELGKGLRQFIGKAKSGERTSVFFA